MATWCTGVLDLFCSLLIADASQTPLSLEGSSFGYGIDRLAIGDSVWNNQNSRAQEVAALRLRVSLQFIT
jgi:hypothetical protein